MLYELRYRVIEDQYGGMSRTMKVVFSVSNRASLLKFINEHFRGRGVDIEVVCLKQLQFEIVELD